MFNCWAGLWRSIRGPSWESSSMPIATSAKCSQHSLFMTPRPKKPKSTRSTNPQRQLRLSGTRIDEEGAGRKPIGGCAKCHSFRCNSRSCSHPLAYATGSWPGMRPRVGHEAKGYGFNSRPSCGWPDPPSPGVCLSGSGPSIVALAQTNLREISELLASVYKPLGIGCRLRTLKVHQGTCDKQKNIFSPGLVCS